MAFRGRKCLNFTRRTSHVLSILLQNWTSTMCRKYKRKQNVSKDLQCLRKYIAVTLFSRDIPEKTILIEIQLKQKN